MAEKWEGHNIGQVIWGGNVKSCYYMFTLVNVYWIQGTEMTTCMGGYTFPSITDIQSLLLNDAWWQAKI